MWRHLLILIPACFLFTGCFAEKTPTANISVPTGQTDEAGKAIEAVVNVELDRNGSWAFVRAQEEKTRQTVAQAEIAKAEAEKAKAEKGDNDIVPQHVSLDTPEAIMAFALHQANRQLGQSNAILARTLERIAGEGEQQVTFSYTPMPKNVGSELIDSTGDAGEKLLSTGPANVLSWLFGTSQVVDKAKPDKPTTEIKAGGSVEYVKGGVLSKPVAITEVIQPATPLEAQ